MDKQALYAELERRRESGEDCTETIQALYDMAAALPKGKYRIDSRLEFTNPKGNRAQRRGKV